MQALEGCPCGVRSVLPWRKSGVTGRWLRNSDLATGQTHLDSDGEQRHPELVEGAFASALRQAQDTRSQRKASVGSLMMPYAITLDLAGAPLDKKGELR